MTTLAEWDETRTKKKHPAKFSPTIVAKLGELLDDFEVLGFVLDPFAGVGGVHKLAKRGRFTLGVELEPEWAEQHDDTIVGDATDLHMLADASIDAVVTSPPYGNRMSDKDFRESAAANYAKALGRVSSEGSLNHVKWSGKFTTLLRSAVLEMHRVLKPGAPLLFNFKNHFKNFVEVDTVAECKTLLRECGFRVCGVEEVTVPNMGFGANSDLRAEHEAIVVAVKA